MDFKRKQGKEQKDKGKTKNALELKYEALRACNTITHNYTLKKLYEYKRVIVSKVLILLGKIYETLSSYEAYKVNLTDLIDLSRLVNQLCT